MRIFHTGVAGVCGFILAATFPAYAVYEPLDPVNMPPASVGSITTDIALLRVIGPWAGDDGTQGFSRIVVAAEAEGPALYVQWLSESGDATQTVTARTSGAVPATLALGEQRIEIDESGEKAVFFDLPGDGAATGGETYVLIIGAPGTAQFGPATN